MNNKIFKILTIVLLFGFLAVAKNNVSAVKMEKIVEKLWRERRSCTEEYREYQDEILKFERSRSKLIREIKTSTEFWEFVETCDKRTSPDSMLFVFVFKYINENSSKIFGKEGEEFKKILILKILSMRSKEESREDKFVSGKMGEHIKSSLIRYYKSLEMKSFLESV